MPSRISKELDQLARLARDGGLDLSQVSLRVKADLLMSMPHPPAEDIAAFSEMALALIPTVDEPTATILARKLAGWRHAPAAVLDLLKSRGGEVLVALLRHGMTLPLSEIELLAAQGEPEVALALAERPDLSAAAILMLIARNDPAIDPRLIANGAITLPRAGLDMLLARARDDAAYPPGLLARSDLADAELAPLFLQAGPQRRMAMLESLASIAALGPPERRTRLTPETFASWIATAAADRDGALGALAAHLGHGDMLAQAMADDRSRDLAGLCLIAAGASVEDATRFLIRLGDETAHSVERIFALVSLMRAVTPDVAHRLIAQLAGPSTQPAVRKSRHQPAMDASGTPVRAGEAKTDRNGVIGDMIRKLGARRSQG